MKYLLILLQASLVFGGPLLKKLQSTQDLRDGLDVLGTELEGAKLYCDQGRLRSSAVEGTEWLTKKLVSDEVRQVHQEVFEAASAHHLKKSDKDFSSLIKTAIRFPYTPSANQALTKMMAHFLDTGRVGMASLLADEVIEKSKTLSQKTLAHIAVVYKMSGRTEKLKPLLNAEIQNLLVQVFPSNGLEKEKTEWVKLLGSNENQDLVQLLVLLGPDRVLNFLGSSLPKDNCFFGPLIEGRPIVTVESVVQSTPNSGKLAPGMFLTMNEWYWQLPSNSPWKEAFTSRLVKQFEAVEMQSRKTPTEAVGLWSAVASGKIRFPWQSWADLMVRGFVPKGSATFMALLSKDDQKAMEEFLWEGFVKGESNGFLRALFAIDPVILSERSCEIFGRMEDEAKPESQLQLLLLLDRSLGTVRNGEEFSLEYSKVSRAVAYGLTTKGYEKSTLKVLGSFSLSEKDKLLDGVASVFNKPNQEPSIIGDAGELICKFAALGSERALKMIREIVIEKNDHFRRNAVLRSMSLLNEKSLPLIETLLGKDIAVMDTLFLISRLSPGVRAKVSPFMKAKLEDLAFHSTNAQIKMKAIHCLSLLQ